MKPWILAFAMNFSICCDFSTCAAIFCRNPQISEIKQYKLNLKWSPSFIQSTDYSHVTDLKLLACYMYSETMFNNDDHW